MNERRAGREDRNPAIMLGREPSADVFVSDANLVNEGLDGIAGTDSEGRCTVGIEASTSALIAERCASSASGDVENVAGRIDPVPVENRLRSACDRFRRFSPL